MRQLRTYLAVVTVLFAATQVHAAVIFNDGKGGPILNDPSGYEMTRWVEAQQFSLPGNGIARGAEFWTAENSFAWDFGLPSQTVTWYFFHDDGGKPGSSPFIQGDVSVGSGLVRTPNVPEASLPFPTTLPVHYEVDFGTDINLSAGLDYWFALHFGGSTFFPSFESGIYWRTTNDTDSTGLMHDSLGGTFDNWHEVQEFSTQQGAFRLTGEGGDPVIPEPFSLTIWACVSLLGVALGIRKSRQAASTS
jgi:hypothetical protein